MFHYNDDTWRHLATDDTCFTAVEYSASSEYNITYHMRNILMELKIQRHDDPAQCLEINTMYYFP